MKPSRGLALLTGCALLTCSIANAAERRVALTFDDLPGQTTVPSTEKYEEINARLLRALDSAHAPAIGFVNEGKLYLDGKLIERRVAVLESWLASGRALGNHTFSHADLHRTELEDFLEDVLRGETMLRPMIERPGGVLRYFRHPMLHTGLNEETREGVAGLLSAHGYTVAPVTIDNSEWIFARAFDVALDKGDSALAECVGEAYLDYMEVVFSRVDRTPPRPRLRARDPGRGSRGSGLPERGGVLRAQGTHVAGAVGARRGSSGAFRR